VDASEIARLRVAVTRMARRLRKTSAPGTTPSQLSVLFSVERHGPMTPGELAEREDVRPPSITRIVAALEEEGLLTRRPGDDRRTSLVEVSPDGRRRLAEIRERRDAWLQERLARLGDDEAATLTAALPLLERLLDDR
jgi:DNA-binding MarR family transcriptional regulator